MKRKYKMTGCAKFFIFLLFAVPIAYFASSYYHGEDGLTTLKDKLGIEKILKSDDTNASSAVHTETKELEAVVKELQERISTLEKDVERKDLEIKYLKSQLEAAQAQ